MYKRVGFALLIISHYSQISHENEIIWSHSYVYLKKMGGMEGDPPLNMYYHTEYFQEISESQLKTQKCHQKDKRQ